MMKHRILLKGLDLVTILVNDPNLKLYDLSKKKIFWSKKGNFPEKYTPFKSDNDQIMMHLSLEYVF